MIPRLYSDLHREFDGWEIPVIKGEDEMTLILAGDIAVARKQGTYVDFLLNAAERHAHVVYVPGNHEYYGDSFDRAWDKMQMWFIRDDVPNLHFLNRNSVVIDDVLIVGATLWTDMDNQNGMTMYEAAMRMSDYRAITRIENTVHDEWEYKGKLKPHHTIEVHYQHRDFIDRELANQGEGQKSLVVTHHGPTWQSVSPWYIGSRINGAYVSDLSGLIRERAPTAWVHGHTHHTALYHEGKTLVATNPKGYPENSRYENEDFKTDGLVPELINAFA